MNNFLQVQDLVKYYWQGQEKLMVLKGLNFEITKGEMVAVLGPSGAGKSTLLHLLAGLDLPSSGTIFFKGRDINKLNDRERARFRNEHIGFVYQFYHLLPEFSARENICLPGLIHLERTSNHLSSDKEALSQRALGLLERVGLKDRGHNRPGELSGGEQQRVAIARALINEPEIVLADEPTGNLDRKTAQGVEELIFSLCQDKNLTFVIATHNEALARAAKKIIRITDGQIVI